MKIRISAQQRLSIGIVFLVLSQVLTINLAMQAPALTVSTPEGVPISTTTLNVLTDVTALNGTPVNERLRLEEPDQLGSWQDYFSLITDMNRLYKAALNGTLEADLGDQVFSVSARTRSLFELPLMFWFQLVVGSLAFLIAFGVYAFRPSHLGARHFLIAGFGILLFTLSASVYSTRELVMSGEVMLWLSRLNQLGAFVFTVGLVALLLNYPKRLFSTGHLTWGVYALGLLGWSGFALPWYPETTTAYISVLALFSITFILAVLQWQRTKRSPADRASLKWYLLSIYIGTGLFAIFILLPVALNFTPPASQGLMFIVFLLMFIGIALGVLRYRLFELDRWWLMAWVWLLGGVVLIAVDALLFIGFGLHQDLALTLSLALIGWVYFPLRQALATRFYRTKAFPLARLKTLTERLARAPTENALISAWQQTLLDEWQPLDIKSVPQSDCQSAVTSVIFADSGERLILPHLRENEQLHLYYPDQGHRLFNVNDQQKAQLLLDIGRQALKGLHARLQATAEKKRILSDLHDDVGAKLLSLLYKAETAETQDLVRSALNDLREIVSQPEEGSFLLATGWGQAQAEITGRLADSGKNLHWQTSSELVIVVPHVLWNHLLRILRESVSNIIKHSQATEVWISISVLKKEKMLEISIKDNGESINPQDWELGRGVRNIRYRIEQLSGHCDWSLASPAGVCLTLRVPLPAIDSPGLASDGSTHAV